MDYGNTKTPSMHRSLGSMTVAAGFPWGEEPEFSWGDQPEFPTVGEIPIGQHSCNKMLSLLFN